MKLLTEAEIKTHLKNLKGWQYLPDKKCIAQTFTFTNFIQTFAIMTQIAIYAESKNHHPEWKNVYNKLWIELSTHDAGGVTEKDMDLAFFINQVSEVR